MAYGVIDLNSIASKYFFGWVTSQPNIDIKDKEVPLGTYTDFPYSYEPSVLAEGMVEYFQASLSDIHAVHGVELDSCIICRDTIPSEIRRRLYPDYKGNRATAFSPGLNELRNLVIKAFIPLLKEKYPTWPSIFINGFEGDDCCYVASKVILKGNPCFILSNDGDLIQLIDHHVSVIQYKKDKDYRLITLDNIYDATANKDGLGYHNTKDFILGKILQGDKSDNIAGFPKVGEGTAVKLVHKYGTFANMLAGTPIDDTIAIRGEAGVLQSLRENKNMYDVYMKIIDISYIGKQAYFQQACIEMFNTQV